MLCEQLPEIIQFHSWGKNADYIGVLCAQLTRDLCAIAEFLVSRDLRSFEIHILLECPHLHDIRHKYFTVSSLKHLFETVDSQNIIGFYQRNPLL